VARNTIFSSMFIISITIIPHEMNNQNIIQIDKI
jgi:hypothetical protein